MSKASQGAPSKRKEPEQSIDVGSPVVVERVETGAEVRGIVRELRAYEPQTRLIVETRENELNVARDQAEGLTGVDATLVTDLVGGDDV